MRPEEIHEIQKMVIEMMTATTGPVNDMIRSVMAATVDGLLDARKRMVSDGWPDWLVAQTMEMLVGGARRTAATAPTLMVAHKDDE